MPTTLMWTVEIKDCRKIFALLIAYLLYLVLGAIVFQYFEAPLERDMRIEVSDIIKIFDGRIANPNLNTTSKQFKDMIHTYLVARDMNLVDQYGVLTNHNWNFQNSFFFSTTVITTIGYGHFLPSSTGGKIFCLFYALFGIPMTGVLLGSIGTLFSRCFMSRIKQIRHKYHNDLNPRIVFLYMETAFLFFIPWFTVFLIIPSVIFVVIEGWSFLESFYYSFITLTTIGFGDYVAGNYDGQNWLIIYKLVVVLWIIFGLSYLSMVLNFIGRGYKKVEHSEVVHTSIAHLSEPFLNRTKPKITIRDGNDSGGESSHFTSNLSINSEQKSHQSYKKSNTSVLPYIT